MTKLQFTIPAKIIKAVSAFASNDETRVVIQGVCVETSKDNEGKNKTLFIATNGRMAMIYNATDDIEATTMPEQSESFIIPLSLIQKSEPDEFKRLTVRVWSEEPITFAGLSGKIEMRDKIVEGNYPNWRQIVPSAEPAPMKRLCINPGFLDKFAKFANAVSHSGAGVIIQQRGGEFDALTVHPATAINNWIGVLMPLRGESFSNPTWISI